MNQRTRANTLLKHCEGGVKCVNIKELLNIDDARHRRV